MENTDENIIFKEPRKTLMEILKVNNREVPFANVLSFFFKPKEKHNLETLFLDALLETKYTNIGLDKNNIKIDFVPDYDKKNVRVVVEQPTKNNNRIDLLIETNTFVIAIEFKINHKLNNPLDDYEDYIEKNFTTKKKYYFILTPTEKEAVDKAKAYFENKNEFKQIILRHFLNRVKEKIAEKDLSFEASYEYSYFVDFKQTVENREIRSKRQIFLENLQNKLKKQNIKSEYHRNIKGGFLEIKNNNLQLKVRFTANGIQIEKWTEKDNEKIYGPNKKLEQNELVEIIKTSR